MSGAPRRECVHGRDVAAAAAVNAVSMAGRLCPTRADVVPLGQRVRITGFPPIRARATCI